MFPIKYLAKGIHKVHVGLSWHYNETKSQPMKNKKINFDQSAFSMKVLLILQHWKILLKLWKATKLSRHNEFGSINCFNKVSLLNIQLFFYFAFCCILLAIDCTHVCVTARKSRHQISWFLLIISLCGLLC